MAMNDGLQKAFNDQLNREFFSSYLYLAMAGYFESIDLKGFANWMRVQVDEERFHAMKFYDYIVNRNGVIVLGQIDRPDQSWDSPLKAFLKTLEHEEFITRNINELADLSLSQKDHAAHSFLKFFVDEQVEEESNVHDIIGKLKLIGDSASGLFMLDNELAQRVFTPPATAPAP